MDAPFCRTLDAIRYLAQAMDRAQVDEFEMRIPADLKERHTVVGIAQAVRFGACRALHAAISADKQGDELLVRVKLTWRPGVLCARAFLENRTAELPADEAQALSRAQEILPPDIRAWPEIEREKWIHDWLCAHVTYRGAADELSDNIYDRTCSAVGALLDGLANCQGYSDAFYLLGSLAGLTVNIQIGQAGGNHAWNVIRLDGKWYVLDVTHDDSAGMKTGEPHYYMFNVGMDLLEGLREWDRSAASAAITAKCDGNFFYRHRSWSICTDDVNALASHCAAEGQRGKKAAWGLYTGKDVKDNAWRKAIRKAAEGLPFESFTLQSMRRAGLTYITVRWNES